MTMDAGVDMVDQGSLWMVQTGIFVLALFHYLYIT